MWFTLFLFLLRSKINSELFTLYFQKAVILFQNTTELYESILIQQVELDTTTQQEQNELIFQTAAAFEKFVLNYSNYHVSKSTPPIHVVLNSLGEWTSNFDCWELFRQKDDLTTFTRRGVRAGGGEEKERSCTFSYINLKKLIR